MERYGHIKEEGYPLAAWIWGHRLRGGQHWMEYLLEFLNVLAGFDYEFGQGIEEGVKQPSPKRYYSVMTRLGLRRFVFYDQREKTHHPFDDLARDLLWKALRGKAPTGALTEVDDPLILARTLLRSFSAIEESRSWYAKSLFPVHHNLLFWEGLRKGATKRTHTSIPQDTKPLQLDEGVVFDAHNFFARGGELYYLILSAGTETNLKRRRTIATYLYELLNEKNKAIGDLARVVDETWKGLRSDSDADDSPQGRLGWIPDPLCPLYADIAEDLETFLYAQLDPLECLYLLAHLICFHLSLYIYYRAHPEAATGNVNGNGDFREVCRPMLLIDAMDGADGGIIRRESATLFREQEQRQVQAGQIYIKQNLRDWVNTQIGDFTEHLRSQAEIHFSISRLSQKSRRPYERKVDNLHEKLTQNQLTQQQFIEDYASILFDLLQTDFRKNFLSVHRKLTKSVGLVAPRKGQSARYILDDNLLKTLVLANVTTSQPITYDQFLARLYDRYGLIVGPSEARASGLFDRQRINAEYYDRNKEALLTKMRQAGLAIAYSDATAIVKY